MKTEAEAERGGLSRAVASEERASKGPQDRPGSEVRKPKVHVGTIGHVDHGKTTLTAALTKVAQMERTK